MKQLQVSGYRNRITVLNKAGFSLGWVTPTKYRTFTAYSFKNGSHPTVFLNFNDALSYVEL